MPQGLQYMLQNQDVASSSACRYPKSQDGPCEIRSSVFVRSIIGWKSLGLEHKAESRTYEWQILVNSDFMDPLMKADHGPGDSQAIGYLDGLVDLMLCQWFLVRPNPVPGISAVKNR